MRRWPLGSQVQFVDIRYMEGGEVDYAEVIGYCGTRLVLQIDLVDYGDGTYTKLCEPVAETVEENEVILSSAGG